MKSSTQLTQLEFVLLELVAKGEGKWSWYELANALSRRDVPREPDMMVVLKQLAADGLLKRYVEAGSPRDRWELTDEGNAILKAAQQEKIKLAAKKLINQELEKFDEKELAQVINFIAFVKSQAVGDRDEKTSQLDEYTKILRKLNTEPNLNQHEPTLDGLLAAEIEESKEVYWGKPEGEEIW